MRSRRVRGGPTGGLQAWSVHKVCADEAMLLLDGWVVFVGASPWVVGIVIVVAPLSLYTSARLAQVRGGASGLIN